jgi:hypothetical protein
VNFGVQELGKEFLENANMPCHECNLSKINLRKNFICNVDLTCNLCALLKLGQNFIIARSGCYRICVPFCQEGCYIDC